MNCGAARSPGSQARGWVIHPAAGGGTRARGMIDAEAREGRLYAAPPLSPTVLHPPRPDNSARPRPC
ncbi:hypothetical protein U9M48_028937 [Paspalum notatum var. saurae]|uniref:Uncharacterized protein n=1 Tax=Paspalum notatum var. saurae TaxID=547442 RepID=A0AAQ3X112_PASNO